MAAETVLIVEDRRENIVHLANNVLKPNGYQVITAMDGQRGLKRAQAEQPDLIIMDLNMPKMDGLEVLAALQEREMDIPVILTTFYGSEQVAQQAISLGAVDYIVKPFTVGEMLSAVEKALSNRSALSAKPAEPASGPEEVMPLTRQVERWMRDMNILTQVGKALVAQMDADAVCVRAVEAAIYVTRADHAFLLQVEGDGNELHLRATRGPRDRKTRLMDEPVKSGLAVQVAQSGKTVLQKRVVDDPLLTNIAGRFLGPTIAAPLRWQHQTEGVLIATRGAGEPAFTETDVEWLNGVAEYAAIAVRNARAFQQHAQQTTLHQTDGATLATCRIEVERLAKELRAATETVERLAALLARGEQDSSEIRA